MPNGGIPILAEIRPRSNKDLTVVCRGSEVLIYDRSAFEAAGGAMAIVERSAALPEPILTLRQAETALIAHQIQYWLGDYPFRYHDPAVDVSFI